MAQALEGDYCPNCENDVLFESPRGFWQICVYCAYIWNSPKLLNQLWNQSEKRLKYISSRYQPQDSKEVVTSSEFPKAPQPWDSFTVGSPETLDFEEIGVEDPRHPEHENWENRYTPY